MSAIQLSIWVERSGATDEIVRRIAVQQGAHAGKIFLVLEAVPDNYQPLVFIRSVEETVHQMDILLFVLRIMSPKRIDAKSGRRCNRRRVFALYVKLLPPRRNRRGNDLLGEIFIVDLCDVVKAESPFA